MCSGPVGLAETNSRLNLCPAIVVAVAVRLARGHDRAGQLALRGRVEGDVEEARTGDVDLGHPGGLPQLRGDGLGDLARRAAGRLGELERELVA